MPARKPGKKAGASEAFVRCALRAQHRPTPPPSPLPPHAPGPGATARRLRKRTRKPRRLGKMPPPRTASPRPAQRACASCARLRRLAPHSNANRRNGEAERNDAAARRPRAAPTLRPGSRGAHPHLASPARLQKQAIGPMSLPRQTGERSKNRPDRPQRAAIRSRARGKARRRRPPPF